MDNKKRQGHLQKSMGLEGLIAKGKRKKKRVFCIYTAVGILGRSCYGFSRREERAFDIGYGHVRLRI
jgi:hypothetical protein